MATAKTEPTETTDTPKKPLITFAKDLTPSEKLAALADAKKALEDEALAEVDAKIAALEAQLEVLHKERNAILPPRQQNEHPAGRARSSKSTKGSKEKTTPVESAKDLTDRIKATADGILNVRNEKLDLASIKSVVDETPGKFVIERKAPAWPTVSLAK